MVRDFFGKMGFTPLSESETQREFELWLENFSPRETRIKIIRQAYAGV
jgi:hypothetical protein